MSFCVNRNVFFHDHDKIQFAHELRRSRFFDKHYSKRILKRKAADISEKMKKIRKFVTENMKNADKTITRRQCAPRKC